MSERGFTLVEVMVVIVVMGIVASLVMMNISGMDQRKAMQAREILIFDLKHINRLANEQGQVLALELKPYQDGTLYQLMQYSVEATDLNHTWQKFNIFTSKTLPYEMRLEITAIQQNYTNATNQALLAEQAPKLMWLGNGEAKPVRIQVYFQERPLGHEIEIDYLGKVHEK